LLLYVTDEFLLEFDAIINEVILISIFHIEITNHLWVNKIGQFLRNIIAFVLSKVDLLTDSIAVTLNYPVFRNQIIQSFFSLHGLGLVFDQFIIFVELVHQLIDAAYNALLDLEKTFILKLTLVDGVHKGILSHISLTKNVTFLIKK